MRYSRAAQPKAVRTAIGLWCYFWVRHLRLLCLLDFTNLSLRDGYIDSPDFTSMRVFVAYDRPMDIPYALQRVQRGNRLLPLACHNDVRHH